ncbi:lysine-specific demethylase 4C [Caerostris extrusa]|uniref:[histone H3]-trimethyl-L-lysine(9) demethylase n=1 Tax=Caerostris extrusa TaxID=172846 RepID=A0AAV4R758_CAEEX|nr:lysine-specific demethylase 4C [Caerostris extrusa]
MEEFKDFNSYLEFIEMKGAHKAGLAKIIPPEGWKPRKKGYDDINLTIPSPISQVVHGSQGLYTQFNVQSKSLTVKAYEKLANSKKYQTPSHFDYEDLERKYWKNITFNPPIYGADVSGSLYDDDVNEFNIQHLNTILDLVKNDYKIQIEGVNTAYLYFGMWKTTFAWHTEDMDLYSINYLHFGAPKSWYVVPPEHGRRLERLAAGFFHDSRQECNAFLRHKMTIISPSVLKQFSIPFQKITQEPGEFMITFPFGYHSGFNHGFNCAESTNFAMPRWVEYGKRAALCSCRKDGVKISMDVFVRNFQPDRYELWRAGKDIGSHPEDPSRHYAAPPPIIKAAQNKNTKGTLISQKTKRHPVSKIGKSKRTLRSSKVNEWGSDEDTELYDVNDAMISKKPKITKKKSTQSNFSIEEGRSNEVEDEQRSENNEDMQVDNENLQEDVKDELVTCMETKDSIEEVINNDKCGDLKSCADSELVSNASSNKPKSEGEINEGKLTLDSFDNLGNVMDNPPELKPFWLPEMKNVDNNTTTNNNDKSNCLTIHDHMQLLSSKYPHLSQAINSGTFTVVPVNSIPDQSTQNISVHLENNSVSPNMKFKNVSPTLFSSHQPLVSQTWKCETTNKGLKIKIVQPKINESIVEYPNSDPAIHIEKNPHSQIMDNYPVSTSTTAIESSSSKVQRADSSLESWAHPLIDLWQHQPRNFEKEIEFNRKLASIPPHCAVCVLFTPMYNKTNFPPEPSNVPSYSSVRMPAYCYGNSLNKECILDTNSLLRPDGTAPLLICSGGALKPTNDDRWAHIICAVLIPDTFCENVLQKQPINVTQVTPPRQRLKCKYCLKTSQSKASKGACVQCQCGKCYLPYHVTCGYMAGVIFETNDWPKPIHMICTRHASARRKPPKRELTSVSVGEKVIAKHKNKRYYWGNVKKKYNQEYYSILFEDNSISTNTLPEDIIGRSTTTHGAPEMNEKVKVKWTDDKIYNGIFKGSQSCELYIIEFDDGSVLHQERKQIYAADEELPKEVQTKISHSSDRRMFDFEAETEGKRVRIGNYKYNYF